MVVIVTTRQAVKTTRAIKIYFHPKQLHFDNSRELMQLRLMGGRINSLPELNHLSC